MYLFCMCMCVCSRPSFPCENKKFKWSFLIICFTLFFSLFHHLGRLFVMLLLLLYNVQNYSIHFFTLFLAQTDWHIVHLRHVFNVVRFKNCYALHFRIASIPRLIHTPQFEMYIFKLHTSFKRFFFVVTQNLIMLFLYCTFNKKKCTW